MKRQEVLLNLTLLLIIGVLIYFIYESNDAPREISELQDGPAEVQLATGDDADAEIEADDAASAAQDELDEESGEADNSENTDDTDSAIDGPPGSETSYAARPRGGRSAARNTSGDDNETTGASESKEVASAGSNRGGQFGSRNVFRALLTPTPTPTPPPPTPAPTPDIGKALGSWRLLSVYQGKAMIEDVVKTEQGAEGAIWEMPPGDSKQVDVGGGIMKTVTLKAIDDENPYNPEVTFTMEETTAEKKINLDTEPTGGAAKPAPNK